MRVRVERESERGREGVRKEGRDGGKGKCMYINNVFFFNDTATTEIYTLSLHDALPISCPNPRSG